MVLLKRSIAIWTIGVMLSFSGAMAKPQCHETPGSYVNVDGQEVHRPECVTTHQDGETAICNDGSHSFSKHHSGTCSHHGGVAQWE
jgi:Protein of unknown function (DUF3761)